MARPDMVETIKRLVRDVEHTTRSGSAELARLTPVRFSFFTVLSTRIVAGASSSRRASFRAVDSVEAAISGLVARGERAMTVQGNLLDVMKFYRSMPLRLAHLARGDGLHRDRRDHGCAGGDRFPLRGMRGALPCTYTAPA
jgi:hypothetical protein